MDISDQPCKVSIGSSIQVTIQSVDEWGNLLTQSNSQFQSKDSNDTDTDSDPENFSLTVQQIPEKKFHGEEAKECITSCIDNKNGTYTFHLSPKQEGTYQVTVKLGYSTLLTHPSSFSFQASNEKGMFFVTSRYLLSRTFFQCFPFLPSVTITFRGHLRWRSVSC